MYRKPRNVALCLCIRAYLVVEQMNHSLYHEVPVNYSQLKIWDISNN